MTQTTSDAFLSEKLHKQLDVWRTNLVTTDRRQRLLYFKHTVSASLEIVKPGAHGALDLADLGAPFAAMNDVDDLDELEIEFDEDEDEDFTGCFVVNGKTSSQLKAGLRRLAQTSQQVFADRGVWTLYLGLGMLDWSDPADNKPVSSPLILIPVSLHRDSPSRPYQLERTTDEAVVNPVLALKLENDLGIVLPQLDPEDFSVQAVFDSVTTAIGNQHGWEVDHRVILTCFTFQKEAIYQDLKDHEEEILSSGLIQLLALGPDSPSANTFGFEPPSDDVLDQAAPPETLHNILDADSSQRRSIISARDGRSFVMDGPPGTGKSQTIANIIAELMANGKTVLFVSEKAAALDVVRNRLTQVHLDSFILELHSSATSRKQYAETMGEALTSRLKVKNAFTTSDITNLTRVRRDLTDFAHGMNDERPSLGRNLHWALGRLAELNEHRVVSMGGAGEWGSLTTEQLARISTTAVRLAGVWGPVARGDDFLWRDLKLTSSSPGETERHRRLAANSKSAADELIMLLDAIDVDTRIPSTRKTQSAHNRLRLLEHLETRPDGVPTDWLSMSRWPDLTKRAASLRKRTDDYLQRVSRLEASAGPRWIELGIDDTASVESVLRPSQIWRASDYTTSSTVSAAVSSADAAPQELAPIIELARRLASLFGISPDRLTVERSADLVRLARLSTSTALPESTWFNPSVSRALDESRRVLQELVDLVRTLQSGLRQTFTDDVLTIDVEGIKVRLTETYTGTRRWAKQARADRKALKAVTVSGKANQQVLAMLDAAAAWKQADLALSTSEHDHAGRLGGYYRRIDTDFDRVSNAVSVAQEALRLAGADLDTGALSRQLSTAGTPDPLLVHTADQLETLLAAWVESVGATFGPETATAWMTMPIPDLAEGLMRRGEDLRRGAQALADAATIAGRDLTVRGTVTLLEDAAAATEVSAELLNSFDEDSALLGPLYRASESDWTSIESALAWAATAREHLTGPVLPAAAAALSALSIRSVDVEPVIAKWTQTRDSFLDLFTGDRRRELTADLDADLHTAVELLAEMTESAHADIDEWCEHTKHITFLEDVELDSIVEDLITARAPASSVAPVVEYAVLQAWVDATITADKRLSDYRAKDRDALVAEFQELDSRMISESYARVVDACNRRRPNSVGSRGTQLINKEAAKKTRHLPIRTALAEAGEVALELKPCFMMSPLAVSQYLPAGMKFDVVIFDEASQVLPSDAINCIYRGRQLIVAGDDKQLPPTSFFSTGGSDEESDEDGFDDFQSVLDLCKGSGALPSLPLSWHYRSDHESLIAFSNYSFYGGKLHTFPGAHISGDSVGVTFNYVEDGVYKRGASRDNPIEAVTVVDRVLFHAINHPDLSLGVVTFSSAQEDAVLREMEMRSAKETVLSDLLNAHDRLNGFFIKNLENVQGDERDIIIFSVGYGPDENGKLTNTFGPLIRPDGWRRLNVAITRSRQRVEVVCSFLPEQMPPTDNSSILHFQRYLDFARRGMPALALDIDQSEGDAESVFEEDVIREIRAMGYVAVPQVGTAGYRIDIGVKHPDQPGRYLLAVECDGAAYHSSKVARDRDRLREAVLVRLGWTVHRIWGISWVRDRTTQIDRLRAAIEEALSAPEARLKPVVASSNDIPTVESINLEAAPDWAVPYDLDVSYGYEYVEDLGGIEARPLLRDYLQRLVRAEAPIHEAIIHRHVRQDWSVGRIGHRIRENIDQALASARVNGVGITVDATGIWRIKGAPLPAPRYPVDSDSVRKPREVANEEIKSALIRLVDDAVTADEDILSQQVAGIFGWRNTQEVQSNVSTVLWDLVAEGSLTTRADGNIRKA